MQVPLGTEDHRVKHQIDATALSGICHDVLNDNRDALLSAPQSNECLQFIVLSQSKNSLLLFFDQFELSLLERFFAE